MAVGNQIETRSHALGFREEISHAATNEDRFFTWFNGGQTTDDAFRLGEADFEHHIWAHLESWLTHADRDHVLEIGHGGGRILSAAASHFTRAYGVDIHDHNALVQAELQRRGKINCELHQVTDPNLPFADNYFDAIYSFIVLQHVERIAIFRKYVQETSRVLRPGGVALLYFGRQTVLSQGVSANSWRYRIDQGLERWVLPRYRELPARVNCVNLVISRDYARTWGANCGLTCRDQFVSIKNDHQGQQRLGGQIGMVLTKN